MATETASSSLLGDIPAFEIADGLLWIATIRVRSQVDLSKANQPAIGDTELTCTIGVPGAICPVGGAQVTAVPGIVGSEANGNGANVVSGAAWVNAENGLGPLSGED